MFAQQQQPQQRGALGGDLVKTKFYAEITLNKMEYY